MQLAKNFSQESLAMPAPVPEHEFMRESEAHAQKLETFDESARV